MSTGIHPSVSGIILASIFVVLVAWTRLWLSRTRQKELSAPPSPPRPAENTPVILVEVTDSPSVAHATETACLLAKERAAEIVLASVIVMPLSLPLDAYIEEMETASALSLAIARDTVLRHGLPMRMVVRHGRSRASGLLAAVQGSNPDLMVIGVGPSQEDSRWGDMVEKVAQRAGCETIVDRLPAPPSPVIGRQGEILSG